MSGAIIDVSFSRDADTQVMPDALSHGNFEKNTNSQRLPHAILHGSTVRDTNLQMMPDLSNFVSFERDTNVHRWRAIVDLIELEEYSARAPNDFNLHQTRNVGHSASQEGALWWSAVDGGVRHERGEVLMSVDWEMIPRNLVSDFELRQV